MPESAPEHIADELLDWFDVHGRHDLPWQHPRSAYRVWVAEIMLQQTQVATVVGYFNTFMARFPDVHALAAADSDAVMAHWAGLGYYARARNLHAAAKTIVAERHGRMPRDVEALMALPGIGRSTAGAIVAQAFGRWAPILDGNAKRVIARLAAIDARPGSVAYEKPLWALAERYTPRERVTAYTQAIMDLGANVCTRRRPRCGSCPLAEDCLANRHDLQARIPAPRRRAARPQREATLVVAMDAHDRVLLEKRPPVGIWGGLWSLPEKPADMELAAFCREGLAVDIIEDTPLTPIKHAFTHFELLIHPRQVQVTAAARIMDRSLQWHARDDLPGLPAPVARLIDTFPENTSPMSHTVHCIKLDKEAEGLPRPPLPGDLGKRIHEQVSMEAWQQWLVEQTRLINEYGLHLADPKARQFLTEQTEEYFFGSGETAETHYVPPKQ